jgi:hypothetical protein
MVIPKGYLAAVEMANKKPLYFRERGQSFTR